MNLRNRLTMVSIIIGLATVPVAQAQEKKLTRAELPPAIEKTVVEQTKGATIQGFSTEVEAGKRVYEVALTVNGHARAVSMDEQGHVLEVEDELSISSLPPAVKAALTKAAGKGKIEKVETLTKNGKLVAYEADVKTGTKNSEIQVGPDGKKLAHPE
jgi:uncharacterized membrane protein YkoI